MNQYFALRTSAHISDRLGNLAFLTVDDFPDEFVDGFPSELPIGTVLEAVFVGNYRDDGSKNLYCTYGVLNPDGSCFDIEEKSPEIFSHTPGSPDVFSQAKHLLHD